MRKSTDFIQDDGDEDEDEIIVDFTYVVKAYLSSYFIDKSGYVQLEQFREAPLAEGEAKSAELIGEAIKNKPGFIELRKIETARDIASTLSRSQNRVLLDSDTLLLNVSDPARLLQFGNSILARSKNDEKNDEKNEDKVDKNVEKTDDDMKIEENDEKKVDEKVEKKVDEKVDDVKIEENDDMKVDEKNKKKIDKKVDMEVDEKVKKEVDEKVNDAKVDEKVDDVKIEENGDKKVDMKVDMKDDNKDKKDDNAINEDDKDNKGDNPINKNKKDDEKDHKNDSSSSASNDVNNTKTAPKTNDSLDDDKDNKTDDGIKLYRMTVRTCEEPIVETFDVHIDFETLQYAMVGMTVIADFHQLSNGWWYYDN
ncbi:11227_t:CDS:2 [Entrophospora sp. SA101]|nr:11227_t:CDS:2 [Entrophospora sp. SA101]